MAIVGVIPARGGSTTVAKKSIAPCASKPMLSYTCAAANASRSLTRTLLSTDDQEIAEIGRACGVEVPFLRPAGLARADTPMVAVLLHALEWLECEGVQVEALVLLQPTSPLREARHVDEAVELWRASGGASVVSVVEVPHQFGPGSLLRMENGRVTPYFPHEPRHTRRQDKPRAYARNGPAVLVVAPDVVRRGELYGEPTIGYEMPRAVSYDVDDADDLVLVDLIMSQRRGG